MAGKESNQKASFKLTHYIEKYFYIILLCFVGCFLLLRLFKLDELFVGLNIDEAGIYYDAYSLANYKVDRYLNSYPLYMINYGGGQSALYTYLVAILFKIFGPNTFLLRLPIVISNLLLCLCSTFMIKEYKGKTAALFGFVITMIMPYFVMQTRFALDCNLLVGAIALVTYLLVISIKYKKNYLFIITGIVLGISLYTYSLSWLIFPLYLLFIFIFCLKNKQLQFKNILCLLLPAFIIAIPLFIFIYINLIGQSSIHIGPFTIPHLPWFRANELSVSNIGNNIFNIVKLLSFDGFNYNSDSIIGTINYLAIPLFMIGLIFSIKTVIKSNKLSLEFIALSSFISVYIVQLLLMDSNISKVNGIYFSLSLIVIIGYITIFNYKQVIGYISISLYIVTSLLFMITLPSRYNHLLYLFTDNYGSVIAQVKEEFPLLTLYVEPYSDSPSGYYLAATLPDPYSLVMDDTSINGINFTIPDDILEHSVYILNDDDQMIDKLYSSYLQNPDSMMLVSYGDYQIYVVY